MTFRLLIRGDSGRSVTFESVRFDSVLLLLLLLLLLIKNDFLKHKQANISVESRRVGVIMTPFSRQSE